MKTPEEIADTQIEIHADGILAGDEAWFRAQLIAAVEADRAQLRAKLLDYDEWERLASDDEPAVRITKIKETLA